MKLSDFTGKPCRSKLAYEFLPNKKTQLDLKKEAEALKKEHYIDVESKVLLILHVEGKTVSLFQSGKILVRGERDEKEARKVAEKVIKCLE